MDKMDQSKRQDNKDKREFRGLGFHNNDYGHKQCLINGSNHDQALAKYKMNKFHFWFHKWDRLLVNPDNPKHH